MLTSFCNLGSLAYIKLEECVLLLNQGEFRCDMLNILGEISFQKALNCTESMAGGELCILCKILMILKFISQRLFSISV